MQSRWRDITKEAPVKFGWYFVCLSDNGIALRSLSNIRSSDDNFIRSTWDFGSQVLNEPLDTYRYWQPVSFPSPPGDETETEDKYSVEIEEEFSVVEDQEERKEELIAEAISDIGRLTELLFTAAYSEDGGTDIVKISCNMGRAIEIAAQSRRLLDQVLEGEY